MTDQTFPNLKNKLHAPSKKSAFERAKAEAEAKRLREEAETAAVYEDFVKSFSHDEPPPPSQFPSSSVRGGVFRGARGVPPSGPGSIAGSRRHFTGAPSGPAARGGPNSGPGFGQRGGFSGGLSVPPRKRNLDYYMDEPPPNLSDREKARRIGERDGNSGLLAFDNSGPSISSAAAKEDYFPQNSDDDEEDSDSKNAKEQPKPTLQLTLLPPTYTKEDLRSLFKETNPNIVIDGIRIIPAVPQGPSLSGAANTMSIRKSSSAIITLHTETPSSEIDALTSTLQNRYLGYGFRLSIFRQLSSAALAISQPFPSLLSSTSSNGSNPFGAKAVNPRPVHSHSRAPPPSTYHRGGYAPPSSFSQRANPPNSTLQVHVSPPANLRLLRLIHKTVESIFTHGPEFEALLMADESVQKDEKWSFLFDTRGDAHVYYRWRLWEVLSGLCIRNNTKSGSNSRAVEMFEGPGQPLWIPPRKGLRYEWAGSLEDIVDDPDYRSDGDYDSASDSDGDPDRPYHGKYESGPIGGLGLDGKEIAKNYLGPLKRAKLIWLVARVPTATTKVRRGDIARVMAFAIENAAAAEEVVEVLVANVLKPLGYQKQVIGNQPDEENSSIDEQHPATKKDETPVLTDIDTSGARIVGLWLISDVLSNSSLGVRHAWRYRSVMEQKLREAKVMEALGRIYRSEGWGRIRKEKFRRLVVSVLGLWESWCIFPQASHEEFMKAFMEAPPAAAVSSSKATIGATSTTTIGAGQPTPSGISSTIPIPEPSTTKSRWKTVDTSAEPALSLNLSGPSTLGTLDLEMADTEDIDGAPLEDDEDEDLDGVPLADDDDEDLDGIPMKEDENLDGTSMPAADSEPESGPAKQPERPKLGFTGMSLGIGVKFNARGAMQGPGGKRKRPKAEDMFAEDDEEEE